MEVKLNKSLHKLIILCIKYFPIILSTISIIFNTLWLLKIKLWILGYFGYTSILVIFFLYLVSYAFKFCKWHRMPIHYLLISNIINIIDNIFPTLLLNQELLIILIMLFVMFICLTLYFKLHENSNR